MLEVKQTAGRHSDDLFDVVCLRCKDDDEVARPMELFHRQVLSFYVG